MKVCIVEDEEILSKAIKIKLEHEGISVIQVADGSVACSTVKEHCPAVVILDLILSGKDGFEILQELKADPTTSQTPVLVVSNSSEPESVDRVIKLGAEEFLVKSDTPLAVIVEKVKSFLVMHPAPQQAPQINQIQNQQPPQPNM